MYYAMVNRIDENVGRLVQHLDDLGLRERTLLVYTSDHGHYFAKRREEADSFKRLCFDIASRVPLILNWRGHIKGQVCSRLISNVDLASTLLDLCRVKVPSEMHGRSARGLLLTGSQNWRQAVFMEDRPFGDLNNGIFERCVVTENWKLILSSQR